jgi:hypothetical protein
VIDHDLANVASGEEADEEAKRAALEAVGLLLDTFGIPHLHFDGARGVHTWIRLDRDATADELAAIGRLLNGSARHPALAVTGPTFEVFPHGGNALRLPLGVYLGKPRHAVPALSPDECLDWLARPTRATGDQLAALVAAAPAEEPARPAGARRTPAPTTVAPLHAPAAPVVADDDAEPCEDEPVKGWNRWPKCKQAVAINGPAAGKRHAALLMLACEAVESGEQDEGRLFQLLTTMPRPHSQTAQAENEKDARTAIQGAFKLHDDNDPRRFSSCPHVPSHSGDPTSSQHRASFEHNCTPEAAQSCPIHRAWQRNQNLPAFQHVLSSSIWRDGRGNGAGFGAASKAVYTCLLRRSGGDPDNIFPASERYVWAHVINEARRGAIRSALRALAAEGLIECVQAGEPKPGGQPSLYRVPFRTGAWVKELEAKLGTDRLEKNARRELHRAWGAEEPFTP